MSDNLKSLNARDDLRELADRYEQVAALELPLPCAGGGIGARLPQGAQEVLDADEIKRALAKADEWAFHWCFVLLDAEQIDDVPTLTPNRLRLAGEHAAHLLEGEGDRYGLDFRDYLDDMLTRIRPLAARGDRHVRAGDLRCQELGCGGHVFMAIGAERMDDALHCERCRGAIPFHTWSRLPRARRQFITIEHAANLLGTTIPAAKMRASRGKWRRQVIDGRVSYYRADVLDAAGVARGE